MLDHIQYTYCTSSICGNLIKIYYSGKEWIRRHDVTLIQLRKLRLFWKREYVYNLERGFHLSPFYKPCAGMECDDRNVFSFHARKQFIISLLGGQLLTEQTDNLERRSQLTVCGVSEGRTCQHITFHSQKLISFLFC